MSKWTIDDVDLIITDFDGVLTTNQVFVNDIGTEAVLCSRADGLAFDVLKNLKKPVYILSTETNPVVSFRAKKLKVPLIQGVANKLKELKNLLSCTSSDPNKTLYIGNDLNDYRAMSACGLKACPSDSHSLIRSIANIKLTTPGGQGVMRELLEKELKLDILNILYPEEMKNNAD